MVASRGRNNTGSGYRAGEKMREGTARLERSAMLKKLELQKKRAWRQAKIRGIHFQHRRVADVRSDELVGGLDSLAVGLTKAEKAGHGSLISTAAA